MMKPRPKQKKTEGRNLVLMHFWISIKMWAGFQRRAERGKTIEQIRKVKKMEKNDSLYFKFQFFEKTKKQWESIWN